jgi:hypothetical protein
VDLAASRDGQKWIVPLRVPEAHFQLATTALLAILDQTAPLREASSTLDQTAPLAREAAAALADCASNAAPYEQREFTRRLAQLGTEQPLLAQLTTGLQHVLTGEPESNPDR